MCITSIYNNIKNRIFSGSIFLKHSKPLLKYFFEAVPIIILLIIGIKYVFDINSFLDIQLKDETLYLNNGIYFFNYSLPNSQWAPLYSFWYFILSFIESDSIKLYFLNFRILTIILPIFLYTFFRTLSVNKLLAFLIGYFFLISSGNILVNPKVTHFLMIIIIGSLILFSVTKSTITKWYIILFGAFLSSYIRPEFFISFILFFMFFLIKIIRIKLPFNEIKPIIIFIVPILFVIIIVGSPLADGGRGFGAFCQHFSLNWVNWNHSNLNPWTDCREIIKSNFGEISTVYEALIANSHLFIKHMISNIDSINYELSGLYSHTVFSGKSFRFKNIELIVLVFFLAFSTIIDFFSSNLSIIETFNINLNRHKYFIFISITYLIPVLMSVIIIYPRQHYLIVLFVFLFVVIIPLLNVPRTHSDRHKFVSSIVLVGLGVFLLIITPYFTKFFTYKNQNNLETIKFLRNLNINSTVNVLEANGGYHTYLGKNYNYVPPDKKNIAFNKFLDQKKINMIIFSGKLNSLKNFSSDSTWDIFLKNYKQFNFRKETIPNSGNELFFKENLFKNYNKAIN